MKQDLTETILKYGSHIIASEIFQSGYRQPHHLVMTVSDHSMDVTIMSVRMSQILDRLHIRINQKQVVEGALCHDLGILGRDQKFQNNRECCALHPVLSVEEAKKLIPDLDSNTEQIIRRHMWPATALTLPPKSKEALIVMLADKYSAIRELVSIFIGPEFKKNLRRRIRQNVSVPA